MHIVNEATDQGLTADKSKIRNLLDLCSELLLSVSHGPWCRKFLWWWRSMSIWIYVTISTKPKSNKQWHKPFSMFDFRWSSIAPSNSGYKIHSWSQIQLKCFVKWLKRLKVSFEMSFLQTFSPTMEMWSEASPTKCEWMTAINELLNKYFYCSEESVESEKKEEESFVL